MNDLEDLVREELRARVAAAEAAATDEPQAVMPGGLLGGLNRRIRAARLRRRWAASALSAVAVAAAVILPLTLLSPGAGTGPSARPSGPGSVPLTDTAATPAGWAPVTGGTAQISVPAAWRVATRPVCGRKYPDTWCSAAPRRRLLSGTRGVVRRRKWRRSCGNRAVVASLRARPA